MLSLKYLPGEQIEDVKAEFEDYIHRVAQADPLFRDNPPEIEWGISGVAFPPVEVLAEHPLIQSASAAHNEVVGAPRYPGFEAVTDLAWFTGRGIPGFMYGPGPVGTAHSVDEHVSIDELIASTKVLATYQ